MRFCLHEPSLTDLVHSPPRREVTVPIRKWRRRARSASAKARSINSGQTGLTVILPNRPPRRFAPPLLCEEGNSSTQFPNARLVELDLLHGNVRAIGPRRAHDIHGK